MQQLAEAARVKAKRTREALKLMLKKYGNLFMTKGMKIAGTVKTTHGIELKENAKTQHYPP